MRYGIRLKPREEGVLRTLETGTLMHAIMEKFVKEKAYENPTDEIIASVCDRAVKEQLESPDFMQFDAAKNKLSFDRVKKEGAKICKEIAAQFQNPISSRTLRKRKSERRARRISKGLKSKRTGKSTSLSEVLTASTKKTGISR